MRNREIHHGCCIGGKFCFSVHSSIQPFLPHQRLLHAGGMSGSHQLAFLAQHSHSQAACSDRGVDLEIIYSFLRPYWAYSLLAGIGCLLVVSFGPSPTQVSSVAQKSWIWSWQMLYDLIPSTPEGWGAVLVAAAFVFLGLGAAVSLRKSNFPANP